MTPPLVEVAVGDPGMFATISRAARHLPSHIDIEASVGCRTAMQKRYCRRTAMGLNFARLRGPILCGCQICGSVAWCVPSHSLRSSPPTGRRSSAAAGSPSLDVFRRANYDQLLCVGGGRAGVWSILSLAKLSFPKQRRRLSYRVSILCNNAGSGD